MRYETINEKDNGKVTQLLQFGMLSLTVEKGGSKENWQNLSKGFFNRDITISYLYMNAPLNFFNELSMSKR